MTSREVDTLGSSEGEKEENGGKESERRKGRGKTNRSFLAPDSFKIINRKETCQNGVVRLSNQYKGGIETSNGLRRKC